MVEQQCSDRRRVVRSILTFILVLFFIIVLAEFSIRIFCPQPSLFPRKDFLPEYEFMNNKNATVINEMPGKWRFVYTTNEYRNRGKAIPISNRYSTPNIVVLGDSNAFGEGVNDGEEFPAVMQEKLKGYYNITNLSVAGWGLTQQIRRFYEFGQLYSPEIVLLQFCSNDLSDNLLHRVTIIENGVFKFINAKNKLNPIKKFLSHSVIQKSQLYNLLRRTLYFELVLKKARQRSARFDANSPDTKSKTTVGETFYMELLNTFVQDLYRRGIRLIMISVNGELDEFAPNVKKQVLGFDEKGLLSYVEVKDYFKGVQNYSSPQGHAWGKKAHKILGEKLAEVVLSTSIQN